VTARLCAGTPTTWSRARVLEFGYHRVDGGPVSAVDRDLGAVGRQGSADGRAQSSRACRHDRDLAGQVQIGSQPAGGTHRSWVHGVGHQRSTSLRQTQRSKDARTRLMSTSPSADTMDPTGTCPGSRASQPRDLAALIMLARVRCDVEWQPRGSLAGRRGRPRAGRWRPPPARNQPTRPSYRDSTQARGRRGRHPGGRPRREPTAGRSC
jgi:hypothetical protein